MDYAILINYFPQEGQIIKFDYISMIFVIIILVMIVLGIIKGFYGSTFSLLSNVGSIVISILLCKTVGNMFHNTKIGLSLENTIFSWVNEQGAGLLNQPINHDNIDAVLLDAYDTLGIPEVLHNILSGILKSLIPDTGEIPLSEVMAQSLTSFACMIIAFIVLWLICFIIFKLFGLLAKKINKAPVIGPINRIFGGLLGMVTGFSICFGLCYVLSLFFSTGIEFGEVIKAWMGLDDESKWSFSKVLYEINLVQRILESVL